MSSILYDFFLKKKKRPHFMCLICFTCMSHSIHGIPCRHLLSSGLKQKKKFKGQLFPISNPLLNSLALYVML